MIISIGTNTTTVSLSSDFKPKWIPAVKIVTTMNGTKYISDRGQDSDIWESTFTITGDRDDIDGVADLLRADNAQVEIICVNEPIFGPAIDYSSAIVCNIINSKILYKLRDVKTTTIQVTLRAVSGLVHLDYSSKQVFNPVYDFSVDRYYTKNRTPFNSMQTISTTSSQSEYGVITHKCNGMTNDVIESADISFTIFEEEFKNNILYMLDERTFKQAWTTEHLYLVFGTKVFNAVIEKLDFYRSNYNIWKVKMTISRES